MRESIWIGNRTCIAAHFDNIDNLACVVGGRRRFTMFPPDQIRNLYVGPLDLTPAGQPITLVDIRNPGPRAFSPATPRRRQPPKSPRLGPGDAGLHPEKALWWHNVRGASKNFNVLVNYWWREFSSGLLRLTVERSIFLYCLLSMKGLPASQRRGWKALLDYLIFQSEGAALDHLPPQVRGLFGDLTPEKAERIRAILLKNLNRQST